MKFFITVLVVLLSLLIGIRKDNSPSNHSQRIYSDSVSCGTLERDSLEFENLPYYDNNDMLENFLDSINYPSSNMRFAGDPTRLWIPIKFYIIRNSNGSGGVSENRIKPLMTSLNQLFRDNLTLIQFYQTCDVTYIDNSDYMILNDSESRQLSRDHEGYNTIPVFLGQQLDEGANGSMYYSLPITFDPYRSIFLSSLASSDNDLLSTFSHEMGHYLGLDHTQQYYENGRCRREPIDRTRTYALISGCKPFGSRIMCESTGDALRDTPADPNLSGNGSCSYTLGGNDHFGDSYASPPSGSQQPATNNIMSYNLQTCRNTFTRLQVAVMLKNALTNGLISPGSEWLNATSLFDLYEPDNRFQDADTIPYCGSQGRNFHAQFGLSPTQSCGDDWARYVATQSGNVDIFTNGMAGKPSVNTILSVYNASNTLIASNDDKVTGDPYSKVTINATLGSTYFIKVSNKYPTSIGYYKLGVGSDLSGPTISGDSYLCDTENYSMSSLPSGATVAWSISPSWAATLTTSGNVATLTKTTNQVFTLSAVINTSCGSSSPTNKTITSSNVLYTVDGTYNTPTGNVALVPFVKFAFEENNACMSTQTTLSVPAGSTVTWTGPANTWDLNWVQSINDVTIYFTALNQFIVLDAEITNSCGTVWKKFAFRCTTTNHCGVTPLRMAPGPGIKSLSVYPNPTSDELVVNMMQPYDQRTDMEALSRNTAASKFDYKLFNSNGTLVRSAKNNLSSQKVTINVKDVPNGEYFLHVIQGKEITKKQIIVKH